MNDGGGIVFGKKAPEPSPSMDGVGRHVAWPIHKVVMK